MDIAELFRRDPLSYTKDGGELEAIIQRMREARGQFNLGNAKAGSTKPLSEKAKATNALLDKLDLGDLGL